MKSKNKTFTLRAKFIELGAYVDFCRQINRIDLIEEKSDIDEIDIPYQEIKKTLTGEKSTLELLVEQHNCEMEQ